MILGCSSLSSYGGFDIGLAVEIFQHINLLLGIWHHRGVMLGLWATVDTAVAAGKWWSGSKLQGSSSHNAGKLTPGHLPAYLHAERPVYCCCICTAGFYAGQLAVSSQPPQLHLT